VPEVSLHVHHRGINRAAIVVAECDYDRLLRVMIRATARHGVRVHAFAIMTTHYHLVVTPISEDALPKTMQEIGMRYTRYFNRKYGRIGTLWTDRYSAHLIDTESYWYNCFRYVDLNAVAAHLVETPDAYPWTSYRVHALGASSEWLMPHSLYSVLGPTAEARQAAYRAICSVPLTEAEVAFIECPPPVEEPQPAVV
jgi:putative transposase